MMILPLPTMQVIYDFLVFDQRIYVKEKVFEER